MDESHIESMCKQLSSLEESIGKISMDILNLTRSMNAIMDKQDDILTAIDTAMRYEAQTRAKLTKIFR